MEEKLLGKCGFYCGACPTYIKGGCRGCEDEHTTGDCFTRDCVKEKKGNLSDERFAMMSKTYEDEQAQLKVEIVNLQKEVEGQERQIENLEQFIQRVRRYTTLTELTPYALRELVKAVYVEAPDKSSGKRKQKVHIEYDLVGYIPVDELIKAEQA